MNVIKKKEVSCDMLHNFHGSMHACGHAYALFHYRLQSHPVFQCIHANVCAHRHCGNVIQIIHFFEKHYSTALGKSNE